MKKQSSNWFTLIILLSGTLLSVIDVFIVNIAIPSIQAAIHATDGEIQLVIAAYLLSYASFLITGGKAGDHFGKKKVFLWAMGLFTLASCFCGLAQTPLQLNLARFIQGIGASFMIPQVISFIQILFTEPKDRTKAVSWFGITLGIASISGLFLGGLLTSFHFFVAGWRLIFFINLPVGIVALIAGKLYIPETTKDNSKRFDLAGVFLLTIALFCLIIPLIIGREQHWPTWCIALLVVSVPLLYMFFRNQTKKLRSGSPALINVQLFAFKDFNIGLFAVLCYFMVHNSFFLISTILLQSGMHIGTFASGNMFIPLGIAFMTTSLLAPKFMAYQRSLLLAGVILILISLSLQLLYFPDRMISHTAIIAILSIYGLGAGIIIPSLLNVTLKNVPQQFAGAASGLYATFQQTASALGISVIGGLFFTVLNKGASFEHHMRAFEWGVKADMAMLLILFVLLLFLPVKKSDEVFLDA